MKLSKIIIGFTSENGIDGALRPYSLHTGKINIGGKMSFYLFIAISFYLNIVCKNIVCELGLKDAKIVYLFDAHSPSCNLRLYYVIASYF